MSEQQHGAQDQDVSFAEVAAEDPDESVAHEAEATEPVETVEPPADGVESDNDAPPQTPTISSVMSGGPVGDGDQLAP